MEMYLVHSIGLMDRILIMYNFAFDLNLPSRHRTVKNAIQKLQKEDGLPLYAIYSMFSGVRKYRNSVTHECRFIDNDLLMLTTEDSYAREEYRASMPEAALIFKEINRRYDAKMQEFWNVIAQNDKMLTDKYKTVLDVIYAQYKRRVKFTEVKE